MSKEHDRIWLEPAGAPDRCWCQDNQWGDDGIEYVRADLATTEASKEHTPQAQTDPTYLDFITPDEIFDRGPDAVREWQLAVLSELKPISSSSFSTELCFPSHPMKEED